MKRAFVVVIDSLGVGYEEKSKDYGDEGANTLSHIFSATKGIYKIPNLEKMGICNLTDLLVTMLLLAQKSLRIWVKDN